MAERISDDVYGLHFTMSGSLALKPLFSQFFDEPFEMEYRVLPSLTIEPAKAWVQPAPEFILDLSKLDSSIWECPRSISEIHATHYLERTDVLLFGPSHLVDSVGRWTCESDGRPAQYIDYYNTPSYQHIYKGAKPIVTKTPGRPSYNCSISHLSDSDIIMIKEPVFLATALEPDNWGRWLSTVVPKLYHYQSTPIHGSAKFFCRSEKSWQKKLLNFFGINDKTLLDHDPGRTYFCEDVRTVSYSAADITPSQHDMRVYRNIAERCTFRMSSSPEKIFVSRASASAKAPNYRVLKNETALSESLAERGFVIVEPELLPFAEQVRCFAGAKLIVGLGGAGMFNTVFCQTGTRVVIIESGPSFISGHSRLLAALGLRYGVIFGQQDEADSAPMHKSWTVDIPETILAIEGFI